jgi:hypothetical protein
LAGYEAGVITEFEAECKKHFGGSGCLMLLWSFCVMFPAEDKYWSFVGSLI